MEELIKRLERVIQTGAPDKDGMHPISAETVLEVVKQLSELSTNLAEVGTDAISREQAIDALEKWLHGLFGITEADGTATIFKTIRQLPPIQPEPKKGKWVRDGHHIRCNQCGMYMCDTDREGDRIPTEFCPNCGAKMEVNNESN